MVVIVLGAAACRGGQRSAGGISGYEWPDSFAFKIEFVSESRADTLVVARYEERKALRLARRDERFLVWHDSVVKESFLPGREPRIEPFELEDTLPYYVVMGRSGRVTRSEAGCDPVAAGCRNALPSALPLELRRLVPVLPEREPQRGEVWVDTLVFDDTPRSRGLRGSVVTAFRLVGDTVVAGDTLWVVAWRSVRRTFSSAGGFSVITPNQPIEEVGVVLGDRRTGLPVFASWAGGAAAPPGMRALGVSSTGFRGRAYLVGSVIERVLSPE